MLLKEFLDVRLSALRHRRLRTDESRNQGADCAAKFAAKPKASKYALAPRAKTNISIAYARQRA
jgi:hypothetical protein